MFTCLTLMYSYYNVFCCFGYASELMQLLTPANLIIHWMVSVIDSAKNICLFELMLSGD
jgi:hypothetical protein